jgi:hypothetical protein
MVRVKHRFRWLFLLTSVHSYVDGYMDGLAMREYEAGELEGRSFSII